MPEEDPLQALAALEQGGPDAKLLAGGQSLVPLLNLRLARPSVLVDLNGISGLDAILPENGSVRIGALARQAAVDASELVRDRPRPQVPPGSTCRAGCRS